MKEITFFSLSHLRDKQVIRGTSTPSHPLSWDLSQPKFPPLSIYILNSTTPP